MGALALCFGCSPVQSLPQPTICTATTTTTPTQQLTFPFPSHPPTPPQSTGPPLCAVTGLRGRRSRKNLCESPAKAGKDNINAVFAGAVAHVASRTAQRSFPCALVRRPAGLCVAVVRRNPRPETGCLRL